MTRQLNVDQLIEKVTTEMEPVLPGLKAKAAGKACTDAKGADATVPSLLDLARIIDHTLLKPDATEEAVRRLCEEALEHGFASVCVNPANVALCASLLESSPVKVCTVIGFPLGATTSFVKAAEVRDAIASGAREVDMVMNIGALKSGNYELVKRDVQAVVDAARGKALVKVIIETALLSPEEKVKACLIAKHMGADFVKTSTGFSSGGATVEDVVLMRRAVGPFIGVKASGGIRDRATAERMVAAGANRIGASASVAIVTGQ
ncbi:MAG: deoxyribose-phosphate aldolase [Bacillota bacterium]